MISNMTSTRCGSTFLLLLCSAWRKACTAALSLILLSSARGQEANSAPVTAVIQGQYSTSPGPGSEGLFALSGARYQNIYNARDLAAIMPLGGYITQIALRMDENYRDSFSAVIPDIEIRMSTSSATWPDHISTVFAANVGRDETVVFGRNSVTMSIHSSAESTVNAFQLVFPLSHPFYYDPRNGSLNIDMFIYQRSVGPGLVVDAGGGLARAGGIGLESGTTLTGDPVTQLTFYPTPEPEILVLCALGAIVLFAKA